MCNVSCVQRYCDCSPNTAAISVIIFRFVVIMMLIVAPFCAICAVLDEFYQISGDITIASHKSVYDVIDSNNDPYIQLSDVADLMEDMNMEFATSEVPDFWNLTVTIVRNIYIISMYTNPACTYSQNNITFWLKFQCK